MPHELISAAPKPLAVLTLLAVFGPLACIKSASANEDKPAIKENARIIFLGDSITQAGDRPGGYVSLVREAIQKHHPALRVEVIGAGISGHKVPDLEKRLDRDVLSKQPTTVVIYIGINDVWHSLNGKGTSKEDFEQGLLRIIKRIHEADAGVILCTPSVIGEKHDGSNPLDEMLDEYCAISREVAAETKSQLLDLREEFLEHLSKRNSENLEKGILTTDGVHLNPAGNQFVAAKMLAALGAAMQKKSVLRHVVLFKFKDGTTPEQVKEIEREFAALPKKIDTIIDFEFGTDVSVENRSEGFTHCFLVTFADEKGRDTYLPHPAHQDFVKIVLPRLDKVLVVDYWSRD